MKRTNCSLAEVFNDLSAIATGLGLMCFVAFPFVIPFIALTIVFAAPLIIVPAVIGAVVTPPLAGVAWLTRRLWGRQASVSRAPRRDREPRTARSRRSSSGGR